MKKYSFSLTKKEVIEFSIRSTLEQMRLRIGKWLLLLLLCVADIFVKWWMGTLLLFWIFILIGLSLQRTYKIAKESLGGKTRTMWVENGMLITASDTFREEMPCGSIQEVRFTKNLLMLGCYKSKKRLAWYVMPLRIFSGRQDADEFVGIIHNPQAAYNQQTVDSRQNSYSQQTADGMGGYGAVSDAPEAGSELLHINFWLEEERWRQVQMDTAEIMRSNIMGGRNKVNVAWIIFAVVGVAFLYTCIIGASFVIMSILFMLLFMVTVTLNGASVNPEKRIKKQLKKGILDDNVYGNWDISITDTGVAWNSPREGRGFWPWERLSWLIEKETAFYLFWEDKRHSIMIFKDRLGSYERMEELKRICAEKNITYAAGKKVKYVPDTVFILLIVAIFGIYFYGTIKLAVKDSIIRNEGVDYYDATAYGDYDVNDVTAYPDYVPLEEQVKILRSYNFTLSDEIVEAARDSMEEYEHMRIYVEGYPYTWLLTEIGTPDYNDEWEVTGYSDEAFWFDFEGWDISTDYITVLEGMMALAQGSAISSVSNIREDTSAVDWDNGTGSIDVVLEWNGDEYQWTMDMDYDWIDGKVLGILNGLLDKTDEKERFYVTWDNGQGAIVFYCGSEWAKDFEKDTGLELSVCK